MKRSNLYLGLVYSLIGVLCLLIALGFGTPLESLLYGFAGAGLSLGAIILWRYYYWSRPDNTERYQEKIATENIELHDERNTILRDKSGRYAYIIGLVVICLSIVVFAVMGMLNLIENYRLIIAYLAGLAVFQYAAGILLFNHLQEKY